ncbi:hypothetical protein BSP239C_03237 [Brevibacterium sp. 239c]|nr:hypothetical protein BSP239C_03237 [Brevibacterium sp. 239c]
MFENIRIGSTTTTVVAALPTRNPGRTSDVANPAELNAVEPELHAVE